MSGFSACSGCGRHVRLSDSACPFCQTALVTASRGGRTVRDPAFARVSRAALFAGAVLVAGCGNGAAAGEGAGGVTPDGGSGDSSVVGPPVYGAPVGPAGGVARDDGGTPIAQPVYGSPVHQLDGG